MAGADKPCTTCGDGPRYVWGRHIDGHHLAPGDIIQIEGKAKLTTKDGSQTLIFPHSHHSMIVVSVDNSNFFTGQLVEVAHQWAASKVHYNTVRLESMTGTGVMYFYRPQSTKK